MCAQLSSGDTVWPVPLSLSILCAYQKGMLWPHVLCQNFMFICMQSFICMHPILYAMIMGSNTCMHYSYKITRLTLISLKNIFILANGENPDFVAFYLGPHCLSMYLL